MRSSGLVGKEALIAEEAFLQPLGIIEPVDPDDHGRGHWRFRACGGGYRGAAAPVALARNSAVSMPIGQAISRTERPS